MNAWCIGARRRHGASGQDDDLEDADARPSAPERGSTPKGAQDLNHSLPRAHASDAKSSTASAHAREARHQRGTKRARACLAVFCAFLVALSMTRPLYARYIDVFETDGSAEAAAPPPPPPAPPRSKRMGGAWARKFGVFG